MKGSMLRSDARRSKKKKPLIPADVSGQGAPPPKLLGSPPKIAFKDPVGHVLPESLQNFRWNVDKVERKLQEKIQEKTKIAGNFVYQQAYRLLEGSRGDGIDFPSFREQLRIKFGIILDDGELQLLFDKYDEDRNGTIDLNEFIRRVLPPDYNYGRQWFETSQQAMDERQEALKRESRLEFLNGRPGMRQGVESVESETARGDTSDWTMDRVMKQIQAKVQQKTPSGDDQYRRAFKMLRSGRDQGITMAGLQYNLRTKFGLHVTERQMRDLFSRVDIDSSGQIDLQEFLQLVEPPAYTAESRVPNGLWTVAVEEDDSDDDDNDDEASNHGSVHPRGLSRGGEISASMSTLATGYGESQRPGSATGARVRKDRPQSANPKKTAMLQQRRQQLEQQLLHEMAQNRSNRTTEELMAKARQLLAQQRLSMSLADLHNLESLGVDADDTASRTGSTDQDVPRNYSSRPRSAGSTRSSSRQSCTSSCSTASTASVKGAAYMRRPSTATNLRQKCLESRVADCGQGNAATRGANGKATKASGQNKAARRHSLSETSSTTSLETCVHCCGLRPVGGYKQPPRVMRVHPKQSDARPYPFDKVAAKTATFGCR